MKDILAIVPARRGSQGIRDKNVRHLAGISPVARAIRVALAARIPQIVVTTDYPRARIGTWPATVRYLRRPARLATATAPMIAVVQDVLWRVPGSPDQIIVLLQPTQPCRVVRHVQSAIRALRRSGADSVVSVRRLPLTQSPASLCRITAEGRLVPWDAQSWTAVPLRRQEAEPTYEREGTVYACWRRTVETYASMYGPDTWPFIIRASDTCPLDTVEDWAKAVLRLR